MTYGEMVREFHRVYGCSLDQEPTEDLIWDRWCLIWEEHQELIRELFPTRSRQDRDLGKIAKETSDLIYVLVGTLEAFGIDSDEAFRRVHESNMSKLGEDGKPIYRADGKVLKGPNYRPPDMSNLRRHHDKEHPGLPDPGLGHRV